MHFNEEHRSHRIGWLRAAVLGANDGIVSTASLVIGVSSAQADPKNILLAGVAGLVAGAMSMAAGEYVSVSSQSDTERAELELEQRHIEQDPEFEKSELAEIYRKRGLDDNLAEQVADQLMAHDALGAHARDELGIMDQTMANPLEAAAYSAGTFTLGALLPVLVILLVEPDQIAIVVAIVSLLSLFVLGTLAAKAGGAPKLKGAIRVTFWGAMAMTFTALVGSVFGAIL